MNRKIIHLALVMLFVLNLSGPPFLFPNSMHIDRTTYIPEGDMEKQIGYTVIFSAFPPKTSYTKPDGTTIISPAGHLFVTFLWFDEDRQEALYEIQSMEKWEAGVQNQNYLSSFVFESGYYLFVRVDRDAFFKAKSITKGFYCLIINDCIEYGQDIAKTIGLKIPRRGIKVPCHYVDALIGVNTPTE